MHERQLAQVLRSKACRQRIRCAHVFYCFRTEPLPHRAVLCVPPLHGPASTHVPGGQPLVGFGGQHLGADNRPGSKVLPRLTLACVRWRNGLKIVGIVVGSLIETCLRSSRCSEPWDPTRDTPNRWYAGGAAAAAAEQRARDVRTPCAHRRRHQRRLQPQSRPAHLPRPREPFLRAAA